MQDLISIIIPVYNVEQYIDDCMKSLLGQTYKNLEIILVDDGSPDNSGRICDEYAQKDSRIRVIHKENGGLSDARNWGLNIATGKYITFLDSDDAITDDCIEYLYNLLVDNKHADMSICGIKRIQIGETREGNDHTKTEIYTPEQALEVMLYDKGIDVASYAKLYKKEVFSELRFPVGEVYEDTATTYKVIEKCDFIVYGDKQCYFYYTRPGSISKQGRFNKKEYDYIKHTEEMLSYIENKYPKLQKAIDRFFLYSKFRILRLLVFTYPRNKEFEKAILKDIKKIRISVLLDKNVPKRDKAAILTSFLGIGFYKFSWFVYSKLTKRIL